MVPSILHKLLVLITCSLSFNESYSLGSHPFTDSGTHAEEIEGCQRLLMFYILFRTACFTKRVGKYLQLTPYIREAGQLLLFIAFERQIYYDFTFILISP